VLVKTTSSGERIAVAQETGVRDEIARDSALRTLMPFLILVPILLLIVADLVRKMFRPIASLSAKLTSAPNKSYIPLRTAIFLPKCARSWWRSTVCLPALTSQWKLSAGLSRMRRMSFDPRLTALSLQAERLDQADMSDLARERLTVIAPRHRAWP
jgi:two-component system OmpR family sensor kinase